MHLESACHAVNHCKWIACPPGRWVKQTLDVDFCGCSFSLLVAEMFPAVLSRNTGKSDAGLGPDGLGTFMKHSHSIFCGKSVCPKWQSLRLRAYAHDTQHEKIIRACVSLPSCARPGNLSCGMPIPLKLNLSMRHLHWLWWCSERKRKLNRSSSPALNQQNSIFFVFSFSFNSLIGNLFAWSKPREMLLDKDAILRYGGCFAIALAYVGSPGNLVAQGKSQRGFLPEVGTSQNAAIRKLLHISVAGLTEQGNFMTVLTFSPFLLLGLFRSQTCPMMCGEPRSWRRSLW